MGAAFSVDPSRDQFGLGSPSSAGGLVAAAKATCYRTKSLQRSERAVSQFPRCCRDEAQACGTSPGVVP